MAMWRCLYWKNEQDPQLFLAGLKQLPNAMRIKREQESRFAGCLHPARQEDLTDAARSQQVLAEHYFDQKNLDRSLLAYETGLMLEPCWADGWFNAAQISAELGDYADAADEMEHFLRLEPNSKDKDAARAKIVIWKDQAGESTLPTPSRPTIGVKVGAIPPEASPSLKGRSGAYVYAVVPGSPAADADIYVGDLITKVDKEEVSDPSALAGKITVRGGKVAVLELVRAGQTVSVNVAVKNP